MIKISFMGAGSTIFVRNIIGDSFCTDILKDAEIALYDIDGVRLEESRIILTAMNNSLNDGRARIQTYLGEKNRKEALRGADFVVNAIQVGGYIPGTSTDFEIPEKYGLRQTIADTLGIGGIMRGLRTIPVLQAFAEDMEAVCPNALFLNYTNPMAILTGYMQHYTNIRTIGLCHSVQVCSKKLLTALGMEDRLDGRKEKIAGINHMAWLLEIYDKDGTDLYPEIRRRAAKKNATEKHGDMVRYEYIKRLGYYCTESSEHNSEYNPWFIKSRYPQLIDQYNIPLNEYIRRCQRQIKDWGREKADILKNGITTHERSREYATHIMEAVITGKPYVFGGNVLNTGLIDNLPAEACVEVSCIADGTGIHPVYAGRLPEQLAALNITNINPQLLTIKAAMTRKREDIYLAAMFDPHTAAELSIDDIVRMCDELIDMHGDSMNMYR